MSNHRNTSQQLRELCIFSGSEHFMVNGHQIINSNRARGGFKRASADWARDDKIVRDLLIRVFPKLEIDEKQRARAGRWMRVIQLYHRSGHSYGDVAAEMCLSVTAVKSLIQHIRRAANGFPCNRSSKKVNRATFQTDLGAP